MRGSTSNRQQPVCTSHFFTLFFFSKSLPTALLDCSFCSNEAAGGVDAGAGGRGLLHGSHADQICKNVLDDSFFNKCRVDNPPSALTSFAETITSFVTPVLLANYAVTVLLFLPLFVSHDRASDGTTVLNRGVFQKRHLLLLNLMHRVGYTLALNVALYAVFRQRRPCECSTDGVNFIPIGSRYGMPSGDAASGRLL